MFKEKKSHCGTEQRYQINDREEIRLLNVKEPVENIIYRR